MAEINLKARLMMKYDTTANWNKVSDFIPMKGEVIVYTDRIGVDGQPRVGVKIGDGSAYLATLPFLNEDIAAGLVGHVNDSNVHITTEERAFWNNKLNCAILEDELILNRN